ncbi:MAG TPA: hypothetical protein VGE25_16235 [Sediminibacterium sp.]
MINNAVLRTLIILGILFLITYALADGLYYGSTWGIVLSLGSLIALGLSINLYREQQRRLQEEEES